MLKQIIKKKLIVLIVGVIIVGGVIIYLVSSSPPTKITKVAVNSLIARSPSANRDGFPDLNKLTSLNNYTSTSSVQNNGTITLNESVYSTSNYEYTSMGATTIIYNGNVYSILGNLSNTITKSSLSSNDQSQLISYAQQINGLFNDPSVKVKKTGTCQVAGQNGQSWDIYFNQLAQYAQQYVVCTQLPSGYLLSLTEGAHLGSTSQSLTVQFKVNTVGGVNPFTPANL